MRVARAAFDGEHGVLGWEQGKTPLIARLSTQAQPGWHRPLHTISRAIQRTVREFVSLVDGRN